MNESKAYTIKDFYVYYAANTPDFIDYKRFKALMVDFFKITSERLLSGSEELKMPFRLGTVSIGKYRPKTYTYKSLSIDFNETRKHGKTIYHLNNHSNGYKYRLFWAKEIVKNFLIYRYTATMVRANKRELARIVKNNINDFPEI